MSALGRFVVWPGGAWFPAKAYFHRKEAALDTATKPSLRSQLSSMDSGDFTKWVNDRLDLGHRIVDNAITNEVTDGNLTPLDGARLTGGILADLFGYEVHAIGGEANLGS